MSDNHKRDPGITGSVGGDVCAGGKLRYPPCPLLSGPVSASELFPRLPGPMTKYRPISQAQIRSLGAATAPGTGWVPFLAMPRLIK